jgi:hypothetical protein
MSIPSPDREKFQSPPLRSFAGEGATTCLSETGEVLGEGQ